MPPSRPLNGLLLVAAVDAAGGDAAAGVVAGKGAAGELATAGASEVAAALVVAGIAETVAVFDDSGRETDCTLVLLPLAVDADARSQPA